MLVSEIKKDSAVLHQGQPWVVLKTSFSHPAQGKAVYNFKVKNLKNGNIIEITLRSGDMVEEADLERKKVQYLFKSHTGHTFMDLENYDQFELPKELISGQEHFLLEGSEYYVLFFEGSPVNLQLPAKVDLKVTFAPPGDRGDTSGNALKDIETETGFQAKAPLFIKAGDVVRINTETGEYCEKVSK